MRVTKREGAPVQASEDIVRVRQAVRAWMRAQGFSLVEQTKTASPQAMAWAWGWAGPGGL